MIPSIIIPKNINRMGIAKKDIPNLIQYHLSTSNFLKSKFIRSSFVKSFHDHFTAMVDEVCVLDQGFVRYRIAEIRKTRIGKWRRKTVSFLVAKTKPDDMDSISFRQLYSNPQKQSESRSIQR